MGAESKWENYVQQMEMHACSPRFKSAIARLSVKTSMPVPEMITKMNVVPLKAREACFQPPTRPPEILDRALH